MDAVCDFLLLAQGHGKDSLLLSTLFNHLQQGKGGAGTVSPCSQCLGRCHTGEPPSLPILLLQPHTRLIQTPPLLWQSSLERLSYFKGVSKHCLLHIQPQISQVMPFFCFMLCAYLTHTQFFALPTQEEINSFPPTARFPFTPREPWPFLVTQSLSTMLTLSLGPQNVPVGIPVPPLGSGAPLQFPSPLPCIGGIHIPG